MNYLQETLQPYFEFLPYFGIAFLSSFLLTPIIGFLANKLEIYDIPAKLRKPTDKSTKTRIKKTIAPRAGALAVIIPFITILLATGEINKQVVAIIIGVIILTAVGIFDDRYEIDSKYQLLAQIFVALLVVAAGISIDHVQSPFGTSLNLRSIVFPFMLGSNEYSIALPADLITIVWILIMINAINWIFGVDGLGEGINIIAFIAILFISMKYNGTLTAFMASIAAGGILGFLPFNISPSKILSGSSVIVYGFLIAILSILGGVKVSTSVIVLAIPIIDMIWVMVGRINKNGISNIFDIFKITSVGDDTHLHHRLLKLGLSVKQVAVIECVAVGICTIIAFATADLPKVTTITIIATVILIIFSVLFMLLRRGFKLGKKQEIKRKESKKSAGPPETPESRYAY